MTFYQELQLSSVGSKQLIKNTTDPKEKRRHILIYNFKVYLVMAFCVAVVSLYSKLTGSNNSVVGVTVLLAVLVLRQADFGIRTTHGLRLQESLEFLWRGQDWQIWQHHIHLPHFLSMWSAFCS